MKENKLYIIYMPRLAAALRELGFKVYVLDNKKDITNIIDEIKGGESQ